MKKTNETSKQKSTRELALEWWNNTPINKLNLWRKYQETTFTPSGSPDDLTGREVEQIYIKEHLYCVSSNSLVKGVSCKTWCGDTNCLKVNKPNQKQYSQEEVDRLLDQQAARTTSQILKNNQKQFTQFSEELFLKYINKFSEEDKREAFSIMCDILKMGEITQEDLDELEMIKYNHPG